VPPHERPNWLHTDEGLVLRLGPRRNQVPAPIHRLLVGPTGFGLSADAAEDVLRVESRLRHIAADLDDRVEQAERRVAVACALGEAAGRGRGRRAVAHRRRADRALRSAIYNHTAAMHALAEARTLVADTREFVIALDPRHGLLAEAAAGWRRTPDPPPGVVVFDDEQSFLDGDARRGTTSDWGGTTVAGLESFGLAWRRDGDEEDPVAVRGELSLAGPWQLGYLVRTGEIYAIRRCGYLPRQVWLLGGEFRTSHAASDVLGPVVDRMREPNSLILAAEIVRTASLGAPTNHQAATSSPTGSQAQPIGPDEPGLA
jgi:hypothetical protein